MKVTRYIVMDMCKLLSDHSGGYSVYIQPDFKYMVYSSVNVGHPEHLFNWSVSIMGPSILQKSFGTWKELVSWSRSFVDAHPENVTTI